jgi:hypothetical protein
MNRSRLLSAAAILSLMFATPVFARAGSQETGSFASYYHNHDVHHSKLRNDIVRRSQDGAVPPGWYKFPGYPPIPPELNRNLDPSNLGSA